MNDKTLGNIGNTRSPEQERAYQESIGTGTCPFCNYPPEIRERMIYEGQYWNAWHNPFPYGSHQTHIILAPIAHWTSMGDITVAAWFEWATINQKLIKELKLPGGGLVMRFGDNAYNGGSLTHVHSHIQVPDQTGYAIATFFADEKLKALFKSK